MDIEQLRQFWAGELLRVKAELLQISWLMNQGVRLTREMERQLDRLLDQKIYLEKLLDDFKKKD